MDKIRSFKYILKTDREQKRLFLYNPSPEAMLFYGWTAATKGKDILDVFQGTNGELFYILFNQLKESGRNSAVTVWERNEVFWKINVYYRFPFMTVTYEKYMNFEDYRNDDERNYVYDFSFDKFQNSLKYSMMVEKIGDEYFVETIDKGLSDFTGYKTGDKVVFGPQHNATLVSMRILEFCIDNNVPLAQLDYIHIDGKPQYTAVFAIPIVHERVRGLMQVCLLDKSYYFQLMTPRDYAYKNFEDGTYFAKVRYTNGFPNVVECNPGFMQAFPHEKLEAIFDSDIMKKTRSNSVISHGEIQFADGSSYFFSIMPQLGLETYYIYATRSQEISATMEHMTSSLTPRENDVFALIIDGLSSKDISEKLGITDGTVKRITHNIYKKVGVTSRMELLKEAFNLKAI